MKIRVNLPSGFLKCVDLLSRIPVLSEPRIALSYLFLIAVLLSNICKRQHVLEVLYLFKITCSIHFHEITKYLRDSVIPVSEKCRWAISNFDTSFGTLAENTCLRMKFCIKTFAINDLFWQFGRRARIKWILEYWNGF